MNYFLFAKKNGEKENILSELHLQSSENYKISHLWNRNAQDKYRKCKLFSYLAELFSFCKEKWPKGKFLKKTSIAKENKMFSRENIIHKRKILLEKYLGMLYNNDK